MAIELQPLGYSAALGLLQPTNLISREIYTNVPARAACPSGFSAHPFAPDVCVSNRTVDAGTQYSSAEAWAMSGETSSSGGGTTPSEQREPSSGTSLWIWAAGAAGLALVVGGLVIAFK